MTNTFSTYHQTIAVNTLARQRNDLARLATFLTSQGIPVTGEQLLHQPNSWSQVTAVHLQTFIEHQLAQNFTPSTVNVRLATLRRYARLAYEAGVLEAERVREITAVSNLPIDGTKKSTRRGHKKAAPILLTNEDAAYLKSPQTDHPQARRDALLFCLLLDHGLRASEAAALTWRHIELVNQIITIPRDPPDAQTLSADTCSALENYRHDYPKGMSAPTGPLLLATTRALNNGRGGHLIPNTPLNRITISKRVALLGKYLDYTRKKQVTRHGRPATITTGTLSASDCRAYWLSKHAQK